MPQSQQLLHLDILLAGVSGGFSEEPFGVRLWGVGNENWGCGGNFDAVSYAHEYRRFATMLWHVDPTAELVACGHDDAWNVKLLEALDRHTGLADHLSIHCYWNRSGRATESNRPNIGQLPDRALTLRGRHPPPTERSHLVLQLEAAPAAMIRMPLTVPREWS